MKGPFLIRCVCPILIPALSACTPHGPPTYLAPSAVTVRAQSEPSEGRPGFNIFVENTSSVTIIVTSIRLLDCTNIRASCDLHRTKVPVRPGTRVRVYQVVPSLDGQEMQFRYEYTWTPEK